MSFYEYLITNSKKYKIPLSAIEIGFLHSLLLDYVKDESNKDKGIDIANIINEKLCKIISKIYKEK